MKVDRAAGLLMVVLLVGCGGQEQSQAGFSVDSVPAPAPLPASHTLGDGGVSPFYRFEGELPAQSGVLLRHEALEEHQTVPGAGESRRLLYTSTDGIEGQARIAVSGTLFLPPGAAPEGGWPLLLWSHGTVGIADICAPSWTGYVPFHKEHLERWLSNGYAVVTSDYQGLGTEGTHPYLATRPEAYSNLDVVRAVQDADFPVAKRVVVAGQSQGAGAAIATAGFAKGYAPELDLRAVVATGVPYFTPEALVAVQEARPADQVEPMLAYNFLVLSLLEYVDPEFDITDYVHEDVLPTARAVSSVCNRDMRARVQELGLTYKKTFKRSLAEDFERVFDRMQFPSLALEVPVFVGIGAPDDRDTPPRMQERFVTAACTAGSSLYVHLYEGHDHLSVLNHSMKDSIPFVAKRFAGEKVAGNCETFAVP